jgi:RNAse (barnase) inhibitor barstar
MYSSSRFEFVVGSVPDGECLLLTPSISTRDQLFNEYVRGLRFPDYFGGNWDAFIDCLSDLAWIDEDEVTVVHDGLPCLPQKELRLYLECLYDVLSRTRAEDRPKVRFIFREADRAKVEAVLASAE